MKKALLLLPALACLTLSPAYAEYYGVLENFQGTERYPAFVNLSSKDGATQNNFNFSGGGGGFGAGEAADLGPAGVGDFALDGGGALGGGFAGFSLNFNTPVDLTATSNGRTLSGISLDFLDQQNNGDVWVVRLDGPTFDNSKTFTLTPSDTAWNNYSFDLTADGSITGAYDPTNVTAVVLTLASDNGDFAFRLDNVEFTGNLVPISGDVEDFDGYAPASLGAGAGPLANPNNFDGVVETFAFGAGAVTAADLIDLGGGNTAARWSFATTEGGIVFDLGIPGAQADLSGYDSLEIDLAVGDADDAVAVLVEDINGQTFGGRCSASPAVTTTLQTFTLDLDTDFTCGAGLDKSKIHRVAVLPATDGGANGITITVDDVRFTTASNVEDWMTFQ